MPEVNMPQESQLHRDYVAAKNRAELHKVQRNAGYVRERALRAVIRELLARLAMRQFGIQSDDLHRWQDVLAESERHTEGEKNGVADRSS